MTEIKDQPSPREGDGQSIHDLVTADIADRKAIGIERYGTTLQAGNGRDVLVDAYQEALDMACYLRQAIAERDANGSTIGRLTDMLHDRQMQCECCGPGYKQDCSVCAKEIAFINSIGVTS